MTPHHPARPADAGSCGHDSGSTPRPIPTRPTGRSRTGPRLGLLAWACLPAAIVVELVVAAVVRTTGAMPYDLLRSTISDLGVRSCGELAYPLGPVFLCSPAHTLMNASFVVSGVLLAVGAVLTAPLLPRGRLRGFLVTLWVVAGVSTALTGLVPVDVDLALHTLASTPVFLAQPLAHVLTAVALRRTRPRLAAVGVLVGAVTLVTGGGFTLWMEAMRLGGLFERVTTWPALLWLGVHAVTTLRRTSRPARVAATSVDSLDRAGTGTLP